MSETPSSRPGRPRREVRRSRRERQIAIFGVLVIGLGAAAIFSVAVYNGQVDGPFSAPLVTPEGGVNVDDVSLACPPDGAFAASADTVVVRVNNASDVNGLAGGVEDILDGRGFVTVGAVNWTTSSVDEEVAVEIHYGAQGLLAAYTLDRHFEGAALVLDNRADATVDLVLGDAYNPEETLVSAADVSAMADIELTASGECLPVNLVSTVPAPRELPDNPLATASPTPSPES